MAHLGVVAGTKAIDLAVEGAKALIARAKAGDKEDVHTMLDYMEAARIAVWGLGQEREEILSDAALCDVKDKERVDLLANRIDKYLRTNHLRPELERAIDGLGKCRDLVHGRRSERIMKWPLWGPGDRDKALDEVSTLLDQLVSFLNSLGDRLKHLSPSGIGAAELLEVERRCCNVSLTSKGQGCT